MRRHRESSARDKIALHGESLHARGYAPGSSGNISVRLEDGYLITPTNSCLGRIDPERITKLDESGRHISGDRPSKEAFLHFLMYGKRQTAGAVAHLHSTYAVAASCLANDSGVSPLRTLTPYFVMKVGELRVVPYFPPGDEALARAVESVASRHHSILLANHGPVVAGGSVEAAVHAIEELEEAARLHFILDSKQAVELSPAQVCTLHQRFSES
ncbi:MAG: 3-oxo-tetronate 4-phosphate decarboxylase [Pseudomonadota bacterium]